MKTHFRRIDRKAVVEFRVACGTDAHWTRDTTSDKSKVTCKKCLAFIEKQEPKNR
jgi:hypothetical protein